MLKKLLTGVLTLLLPLLLFPQKPNLDSLRQAHDTIDIYYFTGNFDSLHLGRTHKVNSTRITGFNRYDILDQDHKFYTSLGNVGLAHHSLLFEPKLYNGFDFGLHNFDEYFFTSETARYYMHKGPVTYLGFVNGPKKEQILNAAYSQGIGNNFKFTARVNITSSPGEYQRMKADNAHVIFTARFITRDKRYGVLANYFNNRIKAEESGGLLSDFIFENNIESNRRNIQVNLNSADNLIRYGGTSFNQYFFLTRNKEKDTINVAKNKFHLGRISHTFSYNRNYQLFSDDDPLNDYWADFDPVLDSAKSRDSILVKKIENTFTWANISVWNDPEEMPFYLSISLKHQMADVSGYGTGRKFNTLIPYAEAVIRPFANAVISLLGEYTIGDFNNNGFLLKAQWDQGIFKKEKELFSFKAEGYLTSREQGYFYQYYQSNNLRWNNDFKKETISMLGFTAKRKRISGGFKLYNINKPIYLSDTASAAQFDGNLSVLRLFIFHDLRIRKFGINYEIVYQNTSQPDIIKLPPLTARAGIFFTLPIFNNASVIQPGIDLFFHSKYYGNAYLPSIKSYYLQGEKEIGNYVYADVYLSLLLKRFRVFLLFNNVTSFLGNYSYYTVPHYPMQDFAVKFGLSWTFYD